MQTSAEAAKPLRQAQGREDPTLHVHDPLSRGIGTVRYPRLVSNSDESARELARRTLTNLYNERPTWLRLAHHKLDAAVFAAYGWPENMTDDEILEKLLARNLHREPAK